VVSYQNIVLVLPGVMEENRSEFSDCSRWPDRDTSRGLPEYRLGVRFQGLTAACMKMSVVWDDSPCSLVEVYGCFKGDYCFHHQGDE
jgi:hypothetical protein